MLIKFYNFIFAFGLSLLKYIAFLSQLFDLLSLFDIHSVLLCQLLIEMFPVLVALHTVHDFRSYLLNELTDQLSLIRRHIRVLIVDLLLLDPVPILDTLDDILVEVGVSLELIVLFVLLHRQII